METIEKTIGSPEPDAPIPELVKLERILKIHFRDPALCREALTHKSFAVEHSLTYDNQRLELLGDAVIQIVVTEEIFQRYPLLHEGDLTKIRSSLVKQSALAALARDISLGSFLRLGHGETEAHGEARESTLSDAFEALMGAVYLGNGADAAREVLMRLMPKYFPASGSDLRAENPKGALQEYTQRSGLSLPDYQVLSISGPNHKREYEVEAAAGGDLRVTAKASSRKLAEQAAAKRLLAALKEKNARNNKKGKP